MNLPVILISALGLTLFINGCTFENNSGSSREDFEEEDTEIIELLEPTGRYKVGAWTANWIDSSRTEISTVEEKDLRELYVQIWYPIDSLVNGNQTSYFGNMENTILFGEFGNSEWHERFVKVKPNATFKAKISNDQDKYPVVIFSPGFGMSKHYYTTFLEEIASHGFIVVGLDHPYLNPLIDRNKMAINPVNGYWHNFPAAGAANSYEDGIKRLQIANSYFAADHLFAYYKLQEMNSSFEFFRGKFDLANVSSMGHSAGAIAPMALMGKAESPINSFFVYDVSIHNILGGPDIVFPVVIKSSAPIYLFILEYASIPNDEFLKSLPGDIQISRLANASHSELSDLNFIQGKDSNNQEELEKAISNMNQICAWTINSLKTINK